MASSTYLLKFGADYKSVTKALGDINSQLRTLRAEGRDLSNELKLTGDSTVAVRQIENLEKQYDLLKQKQKEYQDAMEKISSSASFDGASKGAQKLQADLSRTASQVSLVKARLDTLKESQAFSGFDQQIRNAQGELSSLESAGRRFSENFRLTGDTKSFDSMLKNMDSQINQAGQLVDALKSKLSAMRDTPGFNEQSEDAVKLKNRISEASGTLDQLKTKYSSLSSERPFVGIDSQLQELDSKIKSAREDARTFSESFKVTGNFSSLTRQLDSLKEQLSLSDQRAEALRRALSQLSRTPGVDMQSSRVRNLQRELVRTETGGSQLRQEIEKIGTTNGIQTATRQGSGLRGVLSSLVGSASGVRSALRGAFSGDTGLSRFKSELNGLPQQISSAVNPIQRLSGGFTIMKGAIANLVSSGIQTAGQGILSIGGSAIKASDQINVFKSTMQAGGFDNTAIKQAQQESQQYAQATVFNVNDILRITGQLASQGIPNFNAVSQSLGNLTAAFGGGSDELNRAGEQLVQVANRGKLTTEDFRTMTEDMGGGSKQLQDQLRADGAFTGDFSEALSNGQISAQEFTKALQEVGQQSWAKNAATQATTYKQSLGTLQETIQNQLLPVADAIKPHFVGAVNSVTNSIQNSGLGDKMAKQVDSAFKALDRFEKSSTFKSIKSHLSEIGSEAGKAMGTAGSAIGSVIGALGKPVGSGGKTPIELALDFISTSIKNVTDIGKSAVTNVIDPIFKAITKPVGKGGKSPLEDALSGLKSISSGLWSILKSGVTFINSVVKALNAPVGKGGKSILQDVFETLGKIVKATGSQLKTVADAVKLVVKQINTPVGGKGGKSAIQIALEGLKAVIDPIKQALGPSVDLFKRVIKLLTTPIGGKGGQSVLSLAFKSVATFIRDAGRAIGGLITVMTGLITFVDGVFSGNWSKAWTGVKQIFGGTVSFIWNGIKSLLGYFYRIPMGIANALAPTNLSSIARNAWNAIVSVFSGAVRWFSGVFSSAVTWIGNHLSWKNLSGIAQNAWNGITGVFGSAWRWFSGVFSSAVTWIGNHLNFNALHRIASDAWNGITSAFSGAVKWMGDLGSNIVRGIWNGIKGMGKWLSDRVHDFVISTIPDNIKKALGIHSPSRLMRDEVGVFIPMGIAQGIDDQASTVGTAMSGLKSTIMGEVQGIDPMGAIQKNSKQAGSVAGGIAQQVGSLRQAQATMIQVTGSVGQLTNGILRLTDRMRILAINTQMTMGTLNRMAMVSTNVNVHIQGLNRSLDELRQEVATTTRRVLRQENLI